MLASSFAQLRCGCEWKNNTEGGWSLLTMCPRQWSWWWLSARTLPIRTIHTLCWTFVSLFLFSFLTECTLLFWFPNETEIDVRTHSKVELIFSLHILCWWVFLGSFCCFIPFASGAKRKMCAKHNLHSNDSAIVELGFRVTTSPLSNKSHCYSVQEN